MAGRQYNAVVVTRGIREFVSRDWRAARDEKDAYWGSRIARLGASEALRVGEALRRQALMTVPSWPSDMSRHEDLAAHVRLADLLRRADSVRRA